MQQTIDSLPPLSEEEQESARRAMETFVTVYQVSLIQVEQYLEEIILDIGPEYSAGYTPWLRSVRDLMRGTFLISHEMPLKSKEGFMDALRVFSFSSAVQFLNDICIASGMNPDRKWAENFKDHIRLMMVAMQKLQQNKQEAAG